MGVKGAQGFADACEVLVGAFFASSAPRRQLHQLQPHLADTRMNQPQLAGDTIGYINFASFLIGTAVIDAYNFKFSVARVDHAYPGTKRKARVSGGQTLSVEAFAISGDFAVKVRSVPTGVADPALNRLDGFAQMSDQRCLHTGSNQEHQRHPTNS